MAADKLTPTAVRDITPNLGAKITVLTATSDDTADYVDMEDYGFATIYAAMMFDVTDNSQEACEISSLHVVMTGTVGENRIVVIGV